MKTRVAIAAALLFASSGAFAAFQDTGVGARPDGMGGVFTAIADDANTIFFNPAGLGQLLHPQLTADYGRLFLGLTDGSNLGTGLLGVVVPLDDGQWGTAGIGATTLQLVGSYQESSYNLAYGRELLPGLYGGVNVKLLQIGYTLDPTIEGDPLFTHGTGVTATSFDLGLLYRLDQNYVFGLSGQNLNHPNMALEGVDDLPQTWRAGFAYYQRSFLWSAEVVQANPETDLDVGAERWFYRHMVAGRIGFQYGSDDLRNLTLGASLRLGNAQVDYSFLLPMAGIDGTAGTQQVALTVRFGKVTAGPIALLEEEEMLGPQPGANDAELAALKQKAEQEGAAVAAGQEQIAALQVQIQDLKGQLAKEEAEQAEAEAAAAKTAAAVAASSATATAPAVATAPAAAVPAPVLVPQVSSSEIEGLKEQIDSLEQELQQKRTQVEQAPAAPSAATCGQFPRPGVYTVQPGDTLQSIAAKTLCDPDLWAQIYVANKDRIQRGGIVAPGQTLLIP